MSHNEDEWHDVCRVLNLDPSEYDGIWIMPDNRVRVLKPQWFDTNETWRLPQSGKEKPRRKIQVDRWDYAYVWSVDQSAEDPIAYLVRAKGCTPGAAKTALNRARKMFGGQS